jgi:YfiH family protein
MEEEHWRKTRPRWKQVHGIAIGEVIHPAQDLGEVDGIWTQKPDQLIGVVTADCVPILLERRDRRAIAAIHAGWRGTASRILDSFFLSLPSELSKPSDWIARIGPSIRACCYQVSEDLISRFGELFPEIPRSSIEPAHRMLDLLAVNQSELARLGVETGFVHPDCTFCAGNGGNPVYFSYRRGDRDSRQYSMISLSSKK